MEVFADCDSPQMHPGARSSSAPRTKPAGASMSASSFVTGTPGAMVRARTCSPRPGADGRFAGVPVDVSSGFDADIPGKPFGDDQDYAFSPDGAAAGVLRAHRRRAASRGRRTSICMRRRWMRALRPSISRPTTPPGMRSRTFSPTATSRGSRRIARASSPTVSTSCCKEARTGAVRALTGGWDRSVARLAASPTGVSCIATADETGQHSAVRGRRRERRAAPARRRWRGG